MATMSTTTTTAFNTLQQKHLFSMTLCKYPSSLSFTSTCFISHFFKFHQEFTSLKTLKETFCSNNNNVIMCSLEHQHSIKTLNPTTQKEYNYGFFPLKSRDERVGRKAKVSSIVGEKTGKKYRKDVDSRRKREMGSGVSSLGSVEERVEIKSKVADKVVDEKMTKFSKKSNGSSKLRNETSNKNSSGSNADFQVGEGKSRKRRKKEKVETPEFKLKAGLDMCSKRGDLLSAISLYDTAQKEGVKLGQYHYTVLLYLCSSAAVGVIRPAKSGSGSRTSDKLDLMNEVPNENVHVRLDPSTSSHGYPIDSSSESHVLSSNKVQEINNSELEPVKYVIPLGNKTERLANKLFDKTSNTSNGFYTGIDQEDSDREREGNSNQEDHKIQVSEDVKKYALVRGFEIYENLCLEKIPLNEATLTSVARMAMSMGNGDMALEMVNKMKEMGINPRLRSYGPALFTFCKTGDIDNAFMVEEHMLENGVYPEEPELEALLRLSVEAGRGDKVYYLLHKVRNSIRKVSPSTADLIERWFRSKPASTVGERNWDHRLIMEAMENGGGGWHGQGWLGKGRWNSARTFIGTDGVCESCGDKLVTIDLDPTETENFAKSVASIAAKRERKSCFQNFQKWLDYYGPFEAVVDAANVGLYSQRHFSTSKVNAIVNGIRQKLPSKKWPLIVLHNKRITGGRMDEPANKTLVEKWKNADALYATPTGSNDDWYWLYAAIKFKCLLVTNDEMRDHIFQLLGNDFFPRWKERHQVHFNFSDSGPEFIMPPPCSVVIQESEKGHWHIPIESEVASERERTWLCVTRSDPERPGSPKKHKGVTCHNKEGHVKTDARSRSDIKLPLHGVGGEIQKKNEHLEEIYSDLKSILSESVSPNYHTLVPVIEEAEKLGRCIIDFQI
ncbi:hypothetical protein AQUCO_02000246v1 [Aquilegia coerulea]|uniref:ribonuclease P n=1 Tax=Aquilegia coerulea TaxID=218851 RepID=A0A2G5DGP0_AQUCA|nr:hypothetical protein AQUCO_02000246v1 [Aquilegia coerulea]